MLRSTHDALPDARSGGFVVFVENAGAPAGPSREGTRTAAPPAPGARSTRRAASSPRVGSTSTPTTTAR